MVLDQEDDDESADGMAFWQALGGKPPQLPDTDAAADAAFEAQAKDDMRLFKVQGPTEQEATALPRPWKQEVMGAGDVFVLHWKGQQMFVWTGNRASVQHKEDGFRLAAALQKADSNVAVRACPQFGEHPVFRSHFQDWSVEYGRGGVGRPQPAATGDKNATNQSSSSSRQPLSNGDNKINVAAAKDKSTRVLEERANRIDIEELEQNALQVPLLTPAIKHDDGSTGQVSVWTINSGKIVRLEKGLASVKDAGSGEIPLWLRSTCCYILHYKFCPGVDSTQVRHVIYSWHGRESTRADRASSTMCMNEVSTLTGGGGFEDRQVLAEGKETKHFVIACGRLLLVSPPPRPSAQYRMFAIVDMGACSCMFLSMPSIPAQPPLSRARKALRHDHAAHCRGEVRLPQACQRTAMTRVHTGSGTASSSTAIVSANGGAATPVGRAVEIDVKAASLHRY